MKLWNSHERHTALIIFRAKVSEQLVGRRNEVEWNQQSFLNQDSWNSLQTWNISDFCFLNSTTDRRRLFANFWPTFLRPFTFCLALANAHVSKIYSEASCRIPQRRVERIQKDPSKIYVPHCTVLHRCADDTGCCMTDRQTCAPKRTQSVDLYFFVSMLLKWIFYSHILKIKD